jgi:hypothetical protein
MAPTNREALIGITGSTNHRVRLLTVFRRVAALSDSDGLAKVPAESPDDGWMRVQ